MAIKLEKLRDVLGDDISVEKMEEILSLDEKEVDVSEYESKIQELEAENKEIRESFENRIKALWFGKEEVSAPEIEAKGVETPDETESGKNIDAIIEESI